MTRNKIKFKTLCWILLPLLVSAWTIRRSPSISSNYNVIQRSRLQSSVWSLHMAMSSSDLKKKRRRGSIAARLSIAAKEAAEKNAKKNKEQPDFFSDEDEVDDEGDGNLSSIIKLSQSIDAELLRPRDGYKPSRETSSMRILLEHNDRAESGEKPNEVLGCRHVAVVFSKSLWEDQITTEYASRLVSLARAMKYDDYRPILICINGSTEPSKNGLVAETSAGVTYFHHLCAANQISLKDTNICIIKQEEYDQSWSPSSLHPLVEEVIGRRYLKDWLKESNVYERPTDEYGLLRQKQRKNIHIHLTLISTDYHLCNLNDMHVRSPRQSPLIALQHDLEHAAKIYKGIAKTTWCFRYSTYPYVYSKSDVAAFLGKCYLIAQELRPLLVNLRGVAEEGEFFQRDNYRALVASRRSLVTLVEEMNDAYQQNKSRKTATAILPPNLKAKLQKTMVNISSKNSSRTNRQVSADIALEAALLSLGRCVDLVRPAGMLSSKSVSRGEWISAVKKLEHFLELMHLSCDPDRPLPAKDWGKLSLENVKTFSFAELPPIFSDGKDMLWMMLE